MKANQVLLEAAQKREPKYSLTKIKLPSRDTFRHVVGSVTIRGLRGHLTIKSNGDYTYTPIGEYTEPETFEYEICHSGSEYREWKTLTVSQ